jgi:Ca2+-binding RTX toxin-like protein
MSMAGSGGDHVDVHGLSHDTIALDHSVFTAFDGAREFESGAFTIGTAASDSNDRIIYDSDTGAPYYDSDGTGDAAMVQFATLPKHLSLSAEDFSII